jgi:hypothetical protein
LQKSRGVLYPHLPPATCNVSKHVNSPRPWPESNLTGVRKGVCPREDRSERGPLVPRRDVRNVRRPQSSRRHSSIRIVAEPVASTIGRTDGALTGAHTWVSRQGMRFVALESGNGDRAEPE